jgi:hypothetical protein
MKIGLMLLLAGLMEVRVLESTEDGAVYQLLHQFCEESALSIGTRDYIPICT